MEGTNPRYDRISTAGQAGEGISAEVQVVANTDLAVRLGFDLNEAHVWVEESSATDADSSGESSDGGSE